MAEKPNSTLPKRAQDLSERRFEKLVALSYAGRRGQQSLWNCVCDCGSETVVFATNLLRGLSKSCGCLRTTPTRHTVSMTANFSEYGSYRAMLGRCSDQSYKGYARYGGRGIVVCDRWLHGADGLTGFDCFMADMGPKPRPGLTIERKDSNGSYSPGNCEWATMLVQQNNKTSNVHLTVDGVTKTIADWAREIGIGPETIRQRLKRGKTPEEAIRGPR